MFHTPPTNMSLSVLGLELKTRLIVQAHANILEINRMMNDPNLSDFRVVEFNIRNRLDSQTKDVDAICEPYPEEDQRAAWDDAEVIGLCDDLYGLYDKIYD